jgi:hypothetical protein
VSPPVAAAFIVNCICIHPRKLPVLVVQQGDRGSTERCAVGLREIDQGAMMEIQQLTKSSDASLKALGIILDAWDEGADAGVAPEMMAYAALFTALTDLVGAYGEEAVDKLLKGLIGRVASGEFTVARTMQ